MKYIQAVDRDGRKLKLVPLEDVSESVLVGEDFSKDLKEIPVGQLVGNGRYDTASYYYHHKVGMMRQVEDEFDM